MPQFFISSAQIEGTRCSIEGEDFFHLVTVRRVKKDDLIKLRKEDGTLVTARAVLIGESSIEAEIISQELSPENRLALSLYAALLKGKKFDLVIQKAVEIGVNRIIPVLTDRTVPVPGDKSSNKLDRWNRIALEAAKQSMRDDIPVVEEIAAFTDIVSGDCSSVKIIAHPGSGASLHELLENARANDVALLIGPEGGFTQKELDLSSTHGWKNMNFGFTQLRAETAAMVLPAVIIYEFFKKKFSAGS
ncbi:MAG: 16S rRNA (uracil(1498)-N(3))-methyltransferase [bacterium]|nr:16S rRNA (uracil(1498)-N(3))-methyltransferase [bacterium]